MVCKNCGQQVMDNAVFCDNCGTRLEEPQKKLFCGSCGAEIEEGSEFCGNCGASIHGHYTIGTNTDKPKKNNTLAIIAIAAVSVIVVILIAAFVGYMYMKRTNSEIEQTTEYIIKNSSEQKNRKTDEKDEKREDADTGNKKDAEEKKADNKTAAPVFSKAIASSVRGTDSEGGQYSVEAVLNDDILTKWVPSKVSGNGISEWIEIYADSTQYVRGIYILNGYHKSREVWENNNRVRSCTITFSDGESRNFMLDDTMDMIRLDLGDVVETTSIRLTINSIYNGFKWNDTAITYLGAY